MKKILFTALPFFLFSCSAIKYGYKMIDWYISSNISSKYDLYLRQSENLSEDIDVFLNSRVNDFNEAENFLELLGKTIEKKETKNIKALQSKGQAIYAGVASDFNQILIKYFFILNESQKKHLKKELLKENKEIENKIAKQSHNNFSEGLEYLLGDLTDEQK